MSNHVRFWDMSSTCPFQDMGVAPLSTCDFGQHAVDTIIIAWFVIVVHGMLPQQKNKKLKLTHDLTCLADMLVHRHTHIVCALGSFYIMCKHTCSLPKRKTARPPTTIKLQTTRTSDTTHVLYFMCFRCIRVVKQCNRFALDHADTAKMFRDHGQALHSRFVKVSREATVWLSFAPTPMTAFDVCQVTSSLNMRLWCQRV